MRSEKETMVREVGERIAASEFVLLADCCGLSNEKLTELRAQLREKDSKLMVVKNSTLRYAAAERGKGAISDLLHGPMALITGATDVTQVAKLLAAFVKANNLPVLKGGILGSLVLQASDVEAMAKIPPREVLLGMLVGTIAAPMSQLVGAMRQKVLTLLWTLKAVETKKAESA